MSARKDILANKGTIKVLDEAASVKKFVELTVVDNVRFNAPSNPVEIKTPSGITIYKNVDLDAEISFDWYHPGDLKKIELLFRGVVKLTSPTGSTLISGEKQVVSFRNAGEAAVIGGYNGAGTAATITTIKSMDAVTTYTVTDDYTVTADTSTGMTLIVQVSGGAIPLNTDVLVTYSYTPLKSQILKPTFGTSLIERFIVIDSYPDCTDTTKYRRYFLPRATVTTELMHQLLEIGKDNNRANILPVTLQFAKPDACDNQAVWYWQDCFNHLQ